MQCSGGAGGVCSVAMGEAAKLVPVVGHIFAGASSFLSVRWLGRQTVMKAREASEKVYGLLLDPHITG